jgi:hypothetical protein
MDAITARRTSLLVAAALVLLAGCGASGGSDASPTTTAVAVSTTSPVGSGPGSTTAAAPTTTAAVATSTAPGGPIESGLVGAWTADAHDLLHANTANVGLPAGVDCTGPVTLRFGPRGGFTETGTAQCTAHGRTGTATYDALGVYRTEGNDLVISGVVSRSRLIVLGVTVRLGSGLAEGRATYAISGNTLTVTYTGTRVGTVVHTYTRA